MSLGGHLGAVFELQLPDANVELIWDIRQAPSRWMAACACDEAVVQIKLFGGTKGQHYGPATPHIPQRTVCGTA